MSKNKKLLYDYDEVTEKDKQTVEEVLYQLELYKDVPLNVSLEKIKTNFKIKEIPKMKVDEGLFYDLFKDENLGVAVQGFTRKKDKNGNEYDVPFLSFNADKEYLDDMMERTITKLKNLILAENK